MDGNDVCLDLLFRDGLLGRFHGVVIGIERRPDGICSLQPRHCLMCNGSSMINVLLKQRECFRLQYNKKLDRLIES